MLEWRVRKQNRILEPVGEPQVLTPIQNQSGLGVG